MWNELLIITNAVLNTLGISSKVGSSARRRLRAVTRCQPSMMAKRRNFPNSSDSVISGTRTFFILWSVTTLLVDKGETSAN